MSACPSVRLVPLQPEHLLAVLPWFDSPEVQRRLGGREWPERELALRGAVREGEFRGRRLLRAHSFVALDDDGRPVAQVGGDVYDRWTTWDATAGRVVDSEPRRTMAPAYVVDPGRWGQGYGRASLGALVGVPETADVEQFVLGIEPDNAASVRVATAAGFSARGTGPDAEGLVWFSLLRSALPASPPAPPPAGAPA